MRYSYCFQTKCEKYWPDEGEQEIYGDLVVQVRSQSVLPDYIIRVIDVKLVSLRFCATSQNIIKVIDDKLIRLLFVRYPDYVVRVVRVKLEEYVIVPLPKYVIRFNNVKLVNLRICATT